MAKEEIDWVPIKPGQQDLIAEEFQKWNEMMMRKIYGLPHQETAPRKQPEEKTMTMTPDEVREKLGLRPFDEFELDAYRALVREEKVRVVGIKNALEELREARQTGRTTRMICDALAVVSEGKKIAIRAARTGIAMDAVFRAKEFASRLGFDPSLVTIFRDRPGANQGARVFRDPAIVG